MFIRLSRKEDELEIEKLLVACFGTLCLEEALQNIEGRYLLAFDDKKLIAMTGLNWSHEYNGIEIDWTCTHPDKQNQGVMTWLFERICSLTDEKIYCSCWRESEIDKVNLNSLMEKFGFKEVLPNRATWDTRYNCRASRGYYCARYKECLCVQSEDDKRMDSHERYCKCFEDLYLRK